MFPVSFLKGPLAARDGARPEAAAGRRPPTIGTAELGGVLLRQVQLEDSVAWCTLASWGRADALEYALIRPRP